MLVKDLDPFLFSVFPFTPPLSYARMPDILRTIYSFKYLPKANRYSTSALVRVCSSFLSNTCTCELAYGRHLKVLAFNIYPAMLSLCTTLHCACQAVYTANLTCIFLTYWCNSSSSLPLFLWNEIFCLYILVTFITHDVFVNQLSTTK